VIWIFLFGTVVGVATSALVCLCMLSAASRKAPTSLAPPHQPIRRLPILSARLKGDESGGAVVLQPSFGGQRAAPPRFLQ